MNLLDMDGGDGGVLLKLVALVVSFWFVTTRVFIPFVVGAFAVSSALFGVVMVLAVIAYMIGGVGPSEQDADADADATVR